MRCICCCLVFHQHYPKPHGQPQRCWAVSHVIVRVGWRHRRVFQDVKSRPRLCNIRGSSFCLFGIRKRLHSLLGQHKETVSAWNPIISFDHAAFGKVRTDDLVLVECSSLQMLLKSFFVLFPSWFKPTYKISVAGVLFVSCAPSSSFP